MLYIIGIAAVVIVALDAWSNQWAICKAIGALVKNTWGKIAGNR